MEFEQLDFLRAVRCRQQTVPVVLLLLLTAVFISGCASPKVLPQVKAFASAMTLTTSNVEQAYVVAEQEHFDEQFAFAFERYVTNHNFRLEPFHPLITPQNMTVRINMLNGLNAYASGLSSLLGNAPLTNLDNNAAKLGLVLSNLDQTAIQAAFLGSNTVASGDFKIITEAANFIGNWIITAKEQRDAKKSVDKMQEYFPTICHVFGNDMFFIRDSLKQDFKLTTDKLYAYLGTNAHVLDPLQLRSELRRIAVTRANEATLDSALGSTEASLEKLADAHTALAESFTNYDTNLTSFVTAVVSEAESAARTYGSTQTNN